MPGFADPAHRVVTTGLRLEASPAAICPLPFPIGSVRPTSRAAARAARSRFRGIRTGRRTTNRRDKRSRGASGLMIDTTDPHRSPITLHCFHGAPAPPEVVDGWRRYLHLPKPARRAIWHLLGPAVLDLDGSQHQELLASFCKEYGIAKEPVVQAVQSCGFVLSRAAALDLGLAQVHEDLAALTGDSAVSDEDAFDILLARYDGMKTQLRGLIMQETLADHGKVLVGLDWRVDTCSASHRGANLDATVVFLTMRYRDGNQFDRATFQLTPEALKQLKLFCSRFETAE